jgi:hypothetical protein
VTNIEFANYLEDGGVEYLEFPGGHTFRNIAKFLEEDLSDIPRRPTDCHYVSYGNYRINRDYLLFDRV